MYDAIKYVHILAAIVWVGGAFTVQLLAIRAERSPDPADLPRLGREIAVIGQRVFLPASLILFIAGLILVSQRWAFTQLWVSLAILLWLASALTGALYLGPRSGKIGKLFATEGPSSVAGRALLGQVFLVSRLELVSFAVLVFLMVFKPTA